MTHFACANKINLVRFKSFELSILTKYDYD